MVINDKIAFIPIPKNASWSVEFTCKEYNFDLKYTNILWENTDSFTLDKMKNKNNEFLINFIKNNYNDFINAYGDNDTVKKLFLKLIDELEFPEELKKDNKFVHRFSLHILTFISQYNWILNDTVKVKEFHFDRIEEFEDYMSEKLNVDFKLSHVNQTKIDYCAITKTPELIEFVDKYVDGAFKRTKSII